MSSPSSPDEPRELVSKWIDAFNARDLDRMLARMAPDVRFHPLRLNGLDRSYRGHDGVRRWLQRLDELGHRHRIDLSAVRGGSDGEVLAVGSMRLAENADPTRFWLLDRVENGLIVAAHHYLTLTNPDAFPGSEGSAKR